MSPSQLYQEKSLPKWDKECLVIYLLGFQTAWTLNLRHTVDEVETL